MMQLLIEKTLGNLIMLSNDPIVRLFLVGAALAIIVFVLSACAPYKEIPTGTTINGNVVATVVEDMHAVKSCRLANRETFGCRYIKSSIHYVYTIPIQSCLDHELKHVTGWEHDERYTDDCHRDARLYLEDRRYKL